MNPASVEPGAGYASPNDFKGGDVERINKAIGAVSATGGKVIVPRVNRTDKGPCTLWLLDSAILLPSHVTLVLDNCHLKLSDRCRDNFIRSANCGMGLAEIKPLRNIHIVGVGGALLEGADCPRATGDAAKRLSTSGVPWPSTYGSDAGSDSESQFGDWRNIGILMAFVEDFSIENIRIRDSHGWAISLERCAQGRVRDIDFASSGSKTIDGNPKTILNQDGLNLRQGCHDISIENISGYTGDDLVALTAIVIAVKPGAPSSMVTARDNRGGGIDDIRNISMRNIRGFSMGGHHIVRLLSGGGLKMHDIVIDGVLDTSSGTPVRCRAALKIGDSNPAWGGVTPLGDTCRIVVSNIVSRSQSTVLIAGSLSESLISNVAKYDGTGEPVSYDSGMKFIREVKVSNAYNLTAL